MRYRILAAVPDKLGQSVALDKSDRKELGSHMDDQSAMLDELFDALGERAEPFTKPSIILPPVGGSSRHVSGSPA